MNHGHIIDGVWQPLTPLSPPEPLERHYGHNVQGVWVPKDCHSPGPVGEEPCEIVDGVLRLKKRLP